MSPEAGLDDGIPQSAGWFVLNARDAHWRRGELRTCAAMSVVLRGEAP